jgi:hypothetical protein
MEGALRGKAPSAASSIVNNTEAFGAARGRVRTRSRLPDRRPPPRGAVIRLLGVRAGSWPGPGEGGDQRARRRSGTSDR